MGSPFPKYLNDQPKSNVSRRDTLSSPPHEINETKANDSMLPMTGNPNLLFIYIMFGKLLCVYVSCCLFLSPGLEKLATELRLILAELYGLQQILLRGRFASGEIRYGARDAQNAIKSSGGETELLYRNQQ